MGRGADPHRAGLAAAARRAAHLGRPVRVEMAGRWSAWPLVVHPDGAVDDARAPRATPVAGTGGAWDGVGRRSRRRAPALAGVADRPRRRPVGVLAVAGALAATLLVGAFGTGVVTLAAPSAAPAECRDVTLFAVNGSGAAGGETLAAVTDPLVQQVGERLAVVAVAGPEVGASYEASEQQAVTTLTDQVAAQLAACPGSRAMLFGYSQGAHVAGDVAARIGAGQDPASPPTGSSPSACSATPRAAPGCRTVPAGVTGQGVLPAREGGFGALAARTIEVCAPQDPVCATAAGATPPPLEQAVAAPAHIDYPQLAVAPDTPATAWASESLGRLITSLPAPGTAPAGGQPTGTATGAPSAGTTAPGTTAPGTTASGGAGPTGQAPAGGGDYGRRVRRPRRHRRGGHRLGRADGDDGAGDGPDAGAGTTADADAAEPTGTTAPGTSAGTGASRTTAPGTGTDPGYDTGAPGAADPGAAPATTREGPPAAARAPRHPPPRRARGRARRWLGRGDAHDAAGHRPRAAPARALRRRARGARPPPRRRGPAGRGRTTRARERRTAARRPGPPRRRTSRRPRDAAAVRAAPAQAAAARAPEAPSPRPPAPRPPTLTGRATGRS